MAEKRQLLLGATALDHFSNRHGTKDPKQDSVLTHSLSLIKSSDLGSTRAGDMSDV